MSFVPLHLHSQYSILSSTLSVEAIVAIAKKQGLPAVALTDFCNMFGVVDFFKGCKGEKIKPIIGFEIMVAPISRHEKKKGSGAPVGYPLLLLAKNRQGYQNLCKISSIGYMEGFYYTPRVDKEVLEKYKEGLICLSGPLQGKIGQLILQGKEGQLKEELDWFQSIYGESFYLELQRHQMDKEKISEEGMDREGWLYQQYTDLVKNQEKLIARSLELRKERGIELVATNDISYAQREDWKAHEILMNVQSGECSELIERDSFGKVKNRQLNPKRKAMPTHELYFKSPKEMELVFADLPEAITNTVKIAAVCELELDLKTRFYPVFTPPHLANQKVSETVRVKEAEKFLTKLCLDAIEKRYTKEKLEKIGEVYPRRDPMQIVKERLKSELEIITSKEMCDYLLIVYDFISWAKGKGIPVGPGRGSGVGSIILYLIEVTDIEPLRFHLFFERFINPERMSYPDIDVDICMERRSEVIDYTIQKYGKDKVAQIITFGTMKAKMAIKDVGRVLSIPLAKVNEIAKLVPEELNITLKKALEIEPELQKMVEEEEEVKALLDYAQKLEGSIRNTGIHAAGLIICGDPLTDHIPICNAKDSDLVATQYAMKPVEEVGMLKIDFLGLKTLTSIQKCVDAIAKKGEKKIDWVNLPLDNQPAFDLLNQGKTLGIFQLESAGMQELAKQVHIDRFEEIIAVGSLYRPGPMEMIPSYISRKHGREAIEIEHPLMEDILSETYGIMVYQEQVMQIAVRLAGYTLGGGDLLRKAMGKKDRKEMLKQKEKFLSGAQANGIEEATAAAIFDKVEKFASYGFNKSHATGYAYLTYVTAYLKANYPMEWLAALMTCDSDDLSKVAKHIRECELMGIKILPPDVNESGEEFVAAPLGIRFALSAIKGIGSGVVAEILQERIKGGPFTSLYHFFKRVDTSKIGKKLAEHLIEAGAFDFTSWSRAQLLQSIEPLFEHADREQKEKAKGILDFFSLLKQGESSPFLTPPVVENPPDKRFILAKEKELLGFYLTGHPMDEYKEVIKEFGCTPFHEIQTMENGKVCPAAFIIEGIKVKISGKTQRKFAILTISDGMERFELPIWPNLYEEKPELIVENQLLYAILEVEKEGESFKLKCHRIEALSSLSIENASALESALRQVKENAKKNLKGKEKKSFKEKMVEAEKKLEITLDVDRIRLSQIMHLKKLFSTFSGVLPVSIVFHSAKKKIGSVEIDPRWGIEWNEELKKRLEECAFVDSHQLRME
ncbi:MAG: DNA polymerase III subunit alpha [Simkania negevensis]|nr:DNA polymerase III subunit alpha [Simkania negevensis]